MLTLKIVALIITGLVNLLFGLIILLRNTRKTNNLMFSGLAIGLAGWAVGIAGFLGSTNSYYALIWAKVYYFFPLIIGLFLLFFAQSFPNKNLKRNITILLCTPLLIFSSLLVLYPSFIINRIVYFSWGKQILLSEPGYIFYSAYIAIYFSYALFVLHRGNKDLTSIYAAQSKYSFYGVMLASIMGVIFNLLLPGLGNYQIIWLGPLFTNILLISLGVSIIRHKMFDIRLAIVRSLAYLGSLVVLSALYGFIIFSFVKLVLKLNFSFNVELLLSIATGIASLSFASIKKAFNKIANRLFYRDAYDPQEFYDSLNKILISTPEISRLSRQVASLIEKVMKTQFCIIGLGSKDGPDYRVFGTEHLNFKDEDVARTRSLTPYIHKSVIVTDDLDDDQSELKNLLNQNDVSVLVRLTNNVNKSVDGIGYLLLGPKKSGNQYSSLDIQVLDTFSKELVVAIQNSLHYEEIEQFNVTLQDRVNQATSKLRKTNEKLRTLDEAKDDFISMASHQLRTPLTSVKGYISLILDGDAGKISSLQRKMLAQAFSSSQKMVYLIADLLNLSRLKTGKFAIEPSEVNLADLVEEEVAQLIETAKNKQISLIYQKPDNFPKLYLDNTKIRQVVMNYIDNAIYYTQTGGKINIVLEEKAQTIEFKVIDNGIGVPRTEAHHLFTKFYRASNARKNRPDGTGLGLFMVKKIIIAEGGSILFDSKEGEGSTFGFVFAKQKLKITKDDNLKVKSI